jgi:NADPH-dependent curcumin reductase CurA
MPSIPNAAVIFAEVPTGYPQAGKHLKYVQDRTIDIDTVDCQGGIVTKNLVISIDPYMRGRMRAAELKSYSPAFPLNQPLTNFFVGKVVKSDNDKFLIGQYVYGMGNYEEYTVHSKGQAELLRILTDDDRQLGLSLTTWVGAAGMPGQTAYYGLYYIGEPKKGETIFITGASGAVGQIVGQLGRLRMRTATPIVFRSIDTMSRFVSSQTRRSRCDRFGRYRRQSSMASERAEFRSCIQLQDGRCQR